MLLPAMVMLLALPAHAAWGDALKQAGTTLADEQATAAGLSFTPTQAMSGVREVLSMGTDSAVATLGSDGGFAEASPFGIDLPDILSGMPGTGGLTSLMNTAAETAVVPTGELFKTAINDLDASDPTALVSGGSRTITKYFESSSRDRLKTLAKPLVGRALDTAGVSGYAGAVAAASQAAGTPFDMEGYVTDAMLDSMFELIGQKEESIRAGGVEGASQLLRTLF